MTPQKAPEGLLTSQEVAELFRVDAKTVSRWANAGDLPCVRTPGGHLRFPADKVHEMLQVQETAG